ncbi:MAG: ABC transporter substrate-binding protein [Actinomycetota bacterium]
MAVAASAALIVLAGCSEAADEGGDSEPMPPGDEAPSSTSAVGDPVAETDPPVDGADASGTSEERPDGVAVVDGAGTAISLDVPAERVACRNSGCSVTLARLGIVPVASTFEPARADFYWGPDDAATISLMPEGAENYVALEPDLIVVGATDQLIEDLAVIAPLYVVPELGDLAADAEKLTSDLATLTGTVDRGETMIDRWSEFRDGLEAADVAGVADVRLLQLWAGDPAGFSGWTSNSQWCDLLRALDLVGECLFEPITAGTDFAQFSTEAVLASQPSHISYQLEWQYIGEDVALEDRADEAWLRLDAVQNGDAYRVPTSGNFTPSLYELTYELENYLFHVFGPEQGFDDPGNFIDWSGPDR